MSHPLQNLSQLKFNQPPEAEKKASFCIPTKDGPPEVSKRRGSVWVTQVRSEPEMAPVGAGDRDTMGEGSEAY